MEAITQYKEEEKEGISECYFMGRLPTSLPCSGFK
jgi:hypothetical protein